VRQGIANGEFDDNERMLRLDVVFARRYLDALAGWRVGRPASSSWRIAFEAASQNNLIILQHLAAGINAHINLDLGIAAQQVAPGASLQSLHGDFIRINTILAELTDVVKAQIAGLSPWIWLVDTFAGQVDDKIAGLGIRAARDLAWVVANDLNGVPAAIHDERIAHYDTAVSLGAELIRKPGPIARSIFWAIRRREVSDPVRIIDTLSAP